MTRKCRKRRYRSRLDALIALASTQGEHRNKSAAGKRREVRAYRCPDCGGWHLTSRS